MRTSPRSGALLPEHGFSRTVHPSVALDAWRSHDGILVTSSLDDMFLPGTNDTLIGPTWLVSVSHRGQRPTDDHLTRVITAFDMPAYEEDNHYPGVTRALFCPVDPEYRTMCDCKLSETVTVEPDGYTWTNPTDGPCRGCELSQMQEALTGIASGCPLHPR